MRQLTGNEVQGFAIAEKRIMFFLHNLQFKIAAKHELSHLYAFEAWGLPKDASFNEGLAVYRDGVWSNYKLDLLCKHFKDFNRLFTFSSLFKNFYQKNAMIAYPQIGSFTKFLMENYGKDKFLQLWKQGQSEALTIYGKKINILEKEWLASLDQYNVSTFTYLKDIEKL